MMEVTENKKQLSISKLNPITNEMLVIELYFTILTRLLHFCIINIQLYYKCSKVT